MKVKKIKKELKNMVELKKFLKNPSPKVKVPLNTEIEVDQNPNNFGDHTVKKLTLNQRMNKLETSINELTKLVKDGFTELRQDVKDIKIRLDKVETRLDYIVKANNLKDSK